MKKFILFDFDGVIVDSFQPAFEVNKLKCPHITEAEYRSRFDGNIHDHDPSTQVHSAECRLDLDFFEHYIPKMEQSVAVVPGMPEVIEECAKSYVLIVISSTLTLPIQQLLERNDLAKYFEEVMGDDVHKSKVEKIKMIFAKYGVGPQDCVFITDTLGDMVEAEKMGVGAIGVTWGFQLPEALQRGKPFRLVSKPQELISAVSDYFATTAT